MKTREIIEERQIGVRTIVGTEWPILDILERDERPGSRPTWIVTRGLCNGIPESATEHKTLKEAQEEFAK